MIYPTAEDWAWLAGFVDGEGWGGSLRAQGIPLRWGRRPQWLWLISGDAAARILRRRQPMLRIKAANTWLAQEAWAQSTAQRFGYFPLPEEESALREGYALASKYLNSGVARA
jgi:hypothetical protein